MAEKEGVEDLKDNVEVEEVEVGKVEYVAARHFEPIIPSGPHAVVRSLIGCCLLLDGSSTIGNTQ